MNVIRNELKRAVDLILTTNPANNKKKRGHAHISHVSTPRTYGKGKGTEKGKWWKKTSFKPSTGNTGVDLIYYKSDEFSVLTQEQQYEPQYHCNSNRNYKGIWSGKAPGYAKSNNGKKNFLTRAQVSSIIKENNDVKEKDASPKNEMVTEMKEELKG